MQCGVTPLGTRLGEFQYTFLGYKPVPLQAFLRRRALSAIFRTFLHGFLLISRAMYGFQADVITD